MNENYYSTDANETAELLAVDYIRESARARDYVGIGEFMESEGIEWKADKQADFDELRGLIYEKIGSAEIEVSW